MRRIPLLLLALLGCSNDPAAPDPGHPLQGTFTWSQSAGGIAGQTITPHDAGYEVRLEFARTVLRAYRGKELVGETRFTIREDSLQAGPAPVWIVHYQEPLQVFEFARFEEHRLRVTGKVILELSDPCCDRYVHVFMKPFVR